MNNFIKQYLKIACGFSLKIFDFNDPNLLIIHIIYLIVSIKRIRYKGDCVCRLPLMGENDIVNADMTSIEEQCKKCGKTRIRVEDSITFGTTVDEASLCFV